MYPGLRKTVLLALKALIATLSIWFIYRKVMAREDLEQIADSVLVSMENPSKQLDLLIVVFLMFLNWFLETAKWKLLLAKISPTRWMHCFRSVMSGVTVSILTPNRAGEFAGRILHLDPGIRIKAAIASVIGSMNQLMITIVAGGLGLLASLSFYVEDGFIYKVLIIIIIAGILAAVYIYFRIPALAGLAEKIKALRKITLYTAVLEKYSVVNLSQLTFLSALRYCIFTMQFILMITWFDISIPWVDTAKAISLMYLVLAVVPSLALSELTLRGSVALFFFSPYTANSTGILAASSMIWLINLVVPALIGAMAAFYFRLNK